MPGLVQLWPYFIQGLAFGAVYAVTGTGLVVLYRTTGVVNLAFGAIGCFGAHIAWAIMGGSLTHPTPKVHGIRLLGYPLLVIITAGLTLLYGVWIAPKLARRDPLVKALGMTGVALFLLGIMKERWDSSKPRGIGLPTKRINLGNVVVTSTQIIALVFSVLIVVGVNLFLQKTATGTAMRAIANDRDVSALLGVPVRRVETLAWLASGTICGVVFLMFPAMIQSMDQGTLTWFVVPALAGAVVARFRSLWITLFASLGIGVLESILAPFDGNLLMLSKLRKMAPFVVAVLAVLWISRRRTVVLAGREMQ
jgi:branched-chain amino acid transport system permease protein